MKEETRAFHYSPFTQEHIEAEDFDTNEFGDPPDMPPGTVVPGDVVRYSGVVPYRHSRRRLKFLGCSVLPVIMLILGAGWFILQQQATITLTLPGFSRTEHVRITLRVGSANSDTQSSQLHAWSKTGLQTFPVSASGHKDIPATQARGLLLFYNQSPAPQRVAQGTQFQLAGGLTVTLDRDALIPAAILPTPGQVTSPAHIEQSGTRGNIGAGVLNQLLSTSISVSNLSFAGGQEAASLPVLQAQDIEQVVQAHQDGVREQVQQELKMQIPHGEALLDQPQCTFEAQPSVPEGSTTSQGQVRIKASCSQLSYRREEVLAKASAWIHAHGSPPFEGYQMVQAQLQSLSLVPLSQEDRVASVTVQEEWHYILSEGQKQQLKAQVAGMSTSDAQISVCVALPRCEAAVQYPWMWLPDMQKINFIVQYRDRNV